MDIERYAKKEFDTFINAFNDCFNNYQPEEQGEIIKIEISKQMLSVLRPYLCEKALSLVIVKNVRYPISEISIRINKKKTYEISAWKGNGIVYHYINYLYKCKINKNKDLSLFFRKQARAFFLRYEIYWYVDNIQYCDTPRHIAIERLKNRITFFLMLKENTATEREIYYFLKNRTIPSSIFKKHRNEDKSIVINQSGIINYIFKIDKHIVIVKYTGEFEKTLVSIHKASNPPTVDGIELTEDGFTLLEMLMA